MVRRCKASCARRMRRPGRSTSPFTAAGAPGSPRKAVNRYLTDSKTIKENTHSPRRTRRTQRKNGRDDSDSQNFASVTRRGPVPTSISQTLWVSSASSAVRAVLFWIGRWRRAHHAGAQQGSLSPPTVAFVRGFVLAAHPSRVVVEKAAEILVPWFGMPLAASVRDNALSFRPRISNHQRRLNHVQQLQSS